jgi:hypothetical protein
VGGPIDLGLAVYNDGIARISSSGQFGQPSIAQTVVLTPDVTHQLLLDLSALGAGHMCDLLLVTPDLPTSTLTVFRDSTDSRNHTFSWIVPVAPYDAVQQRLQDFIHTNFPNF